VWKEQPGHANDSIYNLGAHLIDQALVLFGRPKEVLGISWPMRGVQGLDDSVSKHTCHDGHVVTPTSLTWKGAVSSLSFT
jgi:predicted dehydrogenase